MLNGGSIEIPFIMVKSSFESRYRQYKCVFCSKLLDKLSQYEDHWLSHIKAQGSSQMPWKLHTSPNTMAEPGSQFDNDDDKGVCERSFSILRGTKLKDVDLYLTSGEKLHSCSNFSEVPGQDNNSNKICKNRIETGYFLSKRPPSKTELPRELGTSSKERSPSDKDELVAVNETVHGVEKESTVMSDQRGTEMSSKLSRDARNSTQNMNLKKVNSPAIGYEPHGIGSILKPNKRNDCRSDGTESLGNVPCSTRTEFDSNKTFLAAQSIFSTSMLNKQEECVENEAKLPNEIPCSLETEVVTVGSKVQKEGLHQERAVSQESQEVAPREASSPNPTAGSSRNTIEGICHGSREDAVIIQMIDPADLKSKVDEVLSEIVIHEEEDNLEPSMPDDEEIFSNENDVQSHSEGEVIILQYEEERCRSDDTESRTVDQLISFANDLNDRMREKQQPGNETLADPQLEGRITSGDAESEPSASSSERHSPKRIRANNSYPLTCKFCNKKFKTKETLRHHSTNQHRDVKIGGFPCEICSKVYDKRLSWKEHMRRCHNPNSELSHCKICGNIYSRPEYLRQHMQCVHSFMIKYSCSLCHQAFKTKFIYDRHMNRFHKDLERFKHKCPHCPWASNTLSRYRQHVNRHDKKEHHV